MLTLHLLPLNDKNQTKRVKNEVCSFPPFSPERRWRWSDKSWDGDVTKQHPWSHSCCLCWFPSHSISPPLPRSHIKGPGAISAGTESRSVTYHSLSPRAADHFLVNSSPRRRFIKAGKPPETHFVVNLCVLWVFLILYDWSRSGSLRLFVCPSLQKQRNSVLLVFASVWKEGKFIFLNF